MNHIFALATFCDAKKNVQIDIQSRFKCVFCEKIAKITLKSIDLCFSLVPNRINGSVKKLSPNSMSISTFPFSGKLPAN